MAYHYRTRCAARQQLRQLCPLLCVPHHTARLPLGLAHIIWLTGHDSSSISGHAVKSATTHVWVFFYSNKAPAQVKLAMCLDWCRLVTPVVTPGGCCCMCSKARQAVRAGSCWCSCELRGMVHAQRMRARASVALGCGPMRSAAGVGKCSL